MDKIINQTLVRWYSIRHDKGAKQPTPAQRCDPRDFGEPVPAPGFRAHLGARDCQGHGHDFGLALLPLRHQGGTAGGDHGGGRSRHHAVGARRAGWRDSPARAAAVDGAQSPEGLAGSAARRDDRAALRVAQPLAGRADAGDGITRRLRGLVDGADQRGCGAGPGRHRCRSGAPDGARRPQLDGAVVPAWRASGHRCVGAAHVHDAVSSCGRIESELGLSGPDLLRSYHF